MSIEKLVGKAKEFNMPAVGLTDHGTFAGAIDFLKECRKEDISPILGCELYQSRDRLKIGSKEQPDGRKGNRHLNVFAKNYQGYQNLCALTQEASVNGYYYDPRIDFELLEKHKDGLIVSSACLSNVINWNLSIDEYDKAKRAVTTYKDVFGEDFYLEMMYHGIDKEGKILPEIQKLSKEMGVKVICTQDAHYAEKADAKYHEYLVCASSGRTIKDPKRLKFPYDEFYFKSQNDMYKIFGHVSEYMTNTMEIAEKCDYSDLMLIEDGGEMRLPNFSVPEGFNSPYEYLEKMAWDGLKKMGKDQEEIYVQRMKQELGDLKLIWDTKRYDFAKYFLIVDDIFKFTKKNDIPASIRGSGYCSLMLRALGLTEGADPIYYGLIWGRFIGISPSRFISEADLGIEVL